MSDRVECRYYGRNFTEREMTLIRALIAGPPTLNRSRLATEFCRRTGWTKPDGGLKSMMARVAMLRMHRDGRIVLPPTQGKSALPKPIPFTQASEPPPTATPDRLEALCPLRLVIVTGAGRAASRRWNEFIARHHYLGYSRLVGAQMRYVVEDRSGQPLAMLGFSVAAWKIAPRDRIIGWPPETRETNLPLVVNNNRFLILPWVRVPNLASHILSIVRRRLPGDWRRQCAIEPVLIETFVETPRFTGTTYRASGWIHVGTTQGRGRNDATNQYALPKKHIWLCPLRRDWKRRLNA